MKNDEVATAQIPPPKDQERRHIEWMTDKSHINNF